MADVCAIVKLAASVGAGIVGGLTLAAGALNWPELAAMIGGILP